MNVKTALLIFSLVIPTMPSACPLCITETGAEVRAMLLGSDFFINLAFVGSPFIFFILIAVVIYYGLPSNRHKP
jgi:hypothetical protein